MSNSLKYYRKYRAGERLQQSVINRECVMRAGQGRGEAITG